MAPSAFGCRACLQRSIWALMRTDHGSTNCLPLNLRRRYIQHGATARPNGYSKTVSHHARKEQLKQGHKRAQIKHTHREWILNRFGSKIEGPNRAALRNELMYLGDPLKLANHVKELISRDDYDKALALTKVGSRAKANIVSWNHLINADMEMDRVGRAFENYNDLKKRGLAPDGHTITILLRGLARHPDHPSSLGRALALYNSIRAPKSQIAPTIIHVNATLTVAARARDMDSMWHILSELPEKGPHAPDQTTFTIMITAMRFHAMTNAPDGETTTDRAIRIESTILEGRRLWSAVIARWRSGDVKIDEELVNTMGRLLLCGARPRDWDDVLSLLHQTMRLERLIPKLGTSGRSETGGIRAPSTPHHMRHSAAGVGTASSGAFQPGEEVSADVFAQKEDKPDEERLAGRDGTHHRYYLQAYARPGPSTLSLALEACLKMVAKDAAIRYWELLTDTAGPFAIAPDQGNMNMYLRVLRQARASQEALTFIQKDFEAAGLTPTRKSYHLGLATCVHDALNPNSMAIAAKMIDHAMHMVKQPGALCFKLYLQVGLQQRPPLNVRQAFDLLEHLDRTTKGVLSLLEFGDSEIRNEPGLTPAQMAAFGAETERERAAAIEVFRTMVKLYDSSLAKARDRQEQMGTTREQWSAMDKQKRVLTSVIFRHDQARLRREVSTKGYRQTKYNPMKRERPWRLPEKLRT